jgi:hypothetical protein
MKKHFITKGAGLLLAAALLMLAACEQPAGSAASTDSDATLKSLSLNAGGLREEFSPELTAYTATVGSHIESITINAEPSSDKARVSGKGAKVLDEGANGPYAITVTAENGGTKTYTLAIRRLDRSTRIIATAAELAKIGVDDDFPLEGNYELAADITLPEDWTPLGRAAWLNEDTPLKDSSRIFAGVFDGKGHTITVRGFSAAVLKDENKPYIGIFAALGGTEQARAEVKNLNIISLVNQEAGNAPSLALGLVCGYSRYAVIENIELSGGLIFSSQGSNSYMGGIAGFVQKETEIRDCSSSMNVTLTGGSGGGLVQTSFYNFVGGFAGIFKDGVEITRCAMTGTVTGHGSKSNSQMFAGGIAGGSYYGFTTEGSGAISYCSNSGDVFADATGFWSWTGGITGVVCGDGDGTFEKTTKVYRCRASGNVTSRGGEKQWPYTGGITGYIYSGGMVAECSFTGTVTSEAKTPGTDIYDYAGGISGYLSRVANHNSVIRDCWSSGTVTGYVNAGGIVGQMQIETYLWNCYSTAAVAVTAAAGKRGSMSGDGAGGIAGLNSSGETGGSPKRPGKKALSSCVALNVSISSAGFEKLGRVIGANSSNVIGEGEAGGQWQDLYAWRDMPVTVNGQPSTFDNRVDGADCVEKPAQSLYAGLGWDFDSVWKMDSDGYPRLIWE